MKDRIGFMNVKRGDRIRRMLADTIEMDLYVVKVDEFLIYGALSETIDLDNPRGAPYWTFDRATGAEEDEDLRWGVKFGQTGSRLVEAFPS